MTWNDPSLLENRTMPYQAGSSARQSALTPPATWGTASQLSRSPRSWPVSSCTSWVTAAARVGPATLPSAAGVTSPPSLVLIDGNEDPSSKPSPAADANRPNARRGPMVVMAIPKRATPDRTSATMVIVRVESRRAGGCGHGTAPCCCASQGCGPGGGDQSVGTGCSRGEGCGVGVWGAPSGAEPPGCVMAGVWHLGRLGTSESGDGVTHFARRAGGPLTCATLEASPSPVYGAALLMRFGSQAHRGFKSLRLRHMNSPRGSGAFSCGGCGEMPGAARRGDGGAHSGRGSLRLRQHRRDHPWPPVPSGRHPPQEQMSWSAVRAVIVGVGEGDGALTVGEGTGEDPVRLGIS